MMRQFGLSLLVLAMLVVPHAWAQTGSDPTQSGSSDQSQGGSTDQPQSGTQDQSQNGPGDQSPSSTGPQVAYTHPEQLPSLTMLNEVTASTGIRLSASTGVLANYNTQGGALHNDYWQTLTQVGGGIHITQVRPTLAWNMTYNGGVSISDQAYTGSRNYTSLNQNANIEILWQFAKRWQMQVSDSYIYTDDPFTPYQTLDGVPTFNNPNPTIYIPLSITEQNVGSVTVNYEMAEHDRLSFTGGESFQRFYDTTLSANDSYSYSAGANYQHQFSPRFSAGGGYNFTALDFGHGLARSGIQAMTGSVTYQISPTMYVTGFLGPEYTASKDIVPTFCFPGFGCFGYHAVHQAEWNIAEGATFGWSGVRNSMRLGFRHQVSNGGGLLGAVSLYQVTAGYRRPLSQHWNFFAGFAYNNSTSIVQYSSSRYLDSIQATVNFSRNISNAWNATIYYAAIHTNQKYLLPQPYTLGANGVGVTLRYTWGHSLGR